MKRTVIVVAATAAGLAGVLAFHTSPPSVTLTPGTGTAAPPQEPASSEPSTLPSPGSGTTGATKTVDGPAVNFSYGVLSVSVTVRGHTIVKVGIARLTDDGSFRSQFIDQQSIPELEQEALNGQNANIQGVSGASYTSAGFRTSLQDALHSLGMQ